MGNRTIDLMTEGKIVLFAYEEAIGFMCGSKVLDKDGISAGVRIAELAAYLETLGLTLSDKLQEIYEEYVYESLHRLYKI
jgi:phosphomannomutase